MSGAHFREEREENIMDRVSCRIGSAELLAQPRAIYVEVSGGVVQAVQNLPERCDWILMTQDR
jgi:hypothetical protein